MLSPISRTAAVATRHADPAERPVRDGQPGDTSGGEELGEGEAGQDDPKGKTGGDARPALERDGAAKRSGVAGEHDDLPDGADREPADIAVLQRRGQVREPGLVADRHDDDDPDDQRDEQAEEDPGRGELGLPRLVGRGLDQLGLGHRANRLASPPSAAPAATSTTK